MALHFKSELNGASASDSPGPIPVKSAKPNIERPRPTRVLPTDRIAFPKQIEILRAYAAAYQTSTKAVSNANIAELIKIQGSTVAMANPFFASMGLLQKVDGGHIPSPEVMEFLRAYDWAPETAAYKLGPLVRQTWFAQAIIPMVAMGQITEDKAILRLADAAAATPDYRPQLRVLIDYLVAAGILEREGDQLKAVKGTLAATEMPRSPEASAQKQTDPETPKAAISTAFTQTPEGAVNLHISIRVTMAEFAGWKPDRITAFFAGMAQVLAAKSGVEIEG